MAAILRAGVDVDCGGFFGAHAQSALDQKLITEADLDARLRMLFRIRMRLGHFDISPLDKIPPSAICDTGAKALARDAVAQSVALVKNNRSRLPFDSRQIKSVAVIGPNAAQQPWDIVEDSGPSNSEWS